MKANLLALALLATFGLYAQDASIRGQLQDTDDQAISYANIALYTSADSSLIKVETSDDAGIFQIRAISPGNYFLVATYLGMPDLRRSNIELGSNEVKDLGVLRFQPTGVDLAEATVTARRALVEVKPDRTVFNVQGTINAVGDNGLDLLRKAPGVTVDNNDNINVLSRSGVLVYVDGKRLPLAGEDLSNYLRSLTAEQIDRIDIITNPGAKYEAEGNAGIIDIRLKKNENEGANGSANYTVNQGRYNRMNGGITGNYRNKNLNIFGNVGSATGQNFNSIYFNTFQNGLNLEEEISMINDYETINFRLGTDFFLGKNHTIGFLVSGQQQERFQDVIDNIEIRAEGQSTIDSVLLAGSTFDDERDQATYNINYRFDPGKGKSLNIDLDYGRFRNESLRRQPNTYVTGDRQTVLSEIINTFDTPVEIDIYTAKLDYEQPAFGGQFGTGVKFSQVSTDNTFLLYDVIGGEEIRNDVSSNRFVYDENVYAAYLSYNRQLGKAWSLSTGLRMEVTDAMGVLTAFRDDLNEDPVILDYVSFFPSAGLTYQVNPAKGNTLSLNYGRRINRPDYNVLNPFRNQISQLSFERGNPFLNPEIVDNIELGYTIAYRYNIKLAYSRTSNQITRLIGPDEIDPRAGFISWDNLASQTVYNLNASLPFQFTKGWSSYFNFSAGYLDNQADYGDGAVVDVQAFTYSIFQQQTIQLPWGITGEISGYFSGPGVWGGVFEYETNWALNLGLQRRFLNDQLNVKLSGNDLFYEMGWDGFSEFNGQTSFGGGRWDSRTVALSLSYNFGNQKVKSRRRNTGIEDEAKRVGSGK